MNIVTDGAEGNCYDVLNKWKFWATQNWQTHFVL